MLMKKEKNMQFDEIIERIQRLTNHVKKLRESIK